MAHAMCICGNRMSNVNCPSDNILIIFKKSLMVEAIQATPNLSLVDFETGLEKKEYWYCQVCQRVYDYYGKYPFIVNRVLTRTPDCSNYNIDDIQHDWEEVFVFTDKRLTALEIDGDEKGENIRDFFKKYEPNIRYFISPDEMHIYAVSKGLKQLKYVYSVELLGGRCIPVNSENLNENFYYGCACGNKLTNMLTSSDTLYLIEEHRIKEIKDMNASISEFVNQNVSSEYWVCSKCKRIHLIRTTPERNLMKIFKWQSKEKMAADKYQNWEHYLSFESESGQIASRWKDTSTNDAIAKIPNIKWLISPDGHKLARLHGNIADIIDLFELEWGK